MKTLLLLRHAKSSWKHHELEDHERPLNKRGKRDAPRVGAMMRQRGLVPDEIYSSSAVRARATIELAAREMEFAGDIAVLEALYHASPDAMLSIVHELAAATERVLLVGHNPGLEEFVAAMVGEIVPMPTAALAVVECPVAEWADVAFERDARLALLWRPKVDAVD